MAQGGGQHLRWKQGLVVFSREIEELAGRSDGRNPSGSKLREIGRRTATGRILDLAQGFAPRQHDGFDLDVWIRGGEWPHQLDEVP